MDAIFDTEMPDLEQIIQCTVIHIIKEELLRRRVVKPWCSQIRPTVNI